MGICESKQNNQNNQANVPNNGTNGANTGAIETKKKKQRMKTRMPKIKAGDSDNLDGNK